MTQAATNNSGSSNTETPTNGKRAEPTAIDAISKISKILDKLSPSDRKRVMAFINESNE